MQMLFENTCVLCRSERLVLRKRRMVLGVVASPECYACENCGCTFVEDELRWKLVETRDKLNPIWQEFNQRSLYVREWLSLAGIQTKANFFDNMELPLPVF